MTFTSTSKAGLVASDVMHYESRAIREGLKASIARLSAAKAYIPSSLPSSAAQQDWAAPSISVNLDRADSGMGPGTSGRHLLYSEMNKALSAFERGPGFQNAPSKEKAFFSALRTLLGDISFVADENVRGMQLTAAFKWFTRNRPRGLTEDPAIFAAMASSLSLQGANQAASPSIFTASGNVVAGRPFVAQGTKHEFFSIYSKDVDARVAAQSPQGVPKSQASAQGSAFSNLSRPPPSAASHASTMPVVMQPGVVRSGLAPTRSQHATAFVANKQLPSSCLSAEARDFGALQPTVPVPRSKLRVEFDPDNKGPTGSGGAARTPAAPGWFSGPVRDGGTRMSNTMQSADRMALRHDRELSPEQAELEELREKWSELDTHSLKTSANIDHHVRKWSMQRARLEEEIVRRQEASRFASPSMHAAAGATGAGSASMQVDRGYLSPYAALASDQLGLDPEAGATKMPGLMVPPSMTGTARDVRTQAAEVHQRDMARIAQHFSLLGLQGVLNSGIIERALAPVPDKAFLECLSKLPRPGDRLPERPGTGPSGKRKASSSKRKNSAKK